MGGYDPEQHIKDMEIDGVAGEVLYPSQGLFYFKVEDSRADVCNLPRPTMTGWPNSAPPTRSG